MAREEITKVLTDVTWIPAAANDNDGPPSPGAPALFWRHWLKRQARTWACSGLFQREAATSAR